MGPCTPVGPILPVGPIPTAPVGPMLPGDPVSPVGPKTGIALFGLTFTPPTDPTYNGLANDIYII